MTTTTRRTNKVKRYARMSFVALTITAWLSSAIILFGGFTMLLILEADNDYFFELSQVALRMSESKMQQWMQVKSEIAEIDRFLVSTIPLHAISFLLLLFWKTNVFQTLAKKVKDYMTVKHNS